MRIYLSTVATTRSISPIALVWVSIVDAQQPPTAKVTVKIAAPLIRAYASAAYAAFSSLASRIR